MWASTYSAMKNGPRARAPNCLDFIWFGVFSFYFVVAQYEFFCGCGSHYMSAHLY